VTLPALITTDATWPEHKNALLGPFEHASGLYVFLVDQTANKLSCWRSEDGGHTWARQHTAGEPSVSSGAGFRVCSAQQPVGEATAEASYCSTIPAPTARAFDMGAQTWSATSMGMGWVFPAGSTAAAVSVNGTVGQFFFTRSSDSARVLTSQSGLETSMGTAYRRVRISRRTAAGVAVNWDLITGSTSTSGGAATHYDLRGGIELADGRGLLFWTNSATTALQARVFNTDDTFSTIINPGSAVVSNTAAYPIGMPVAYTNLAGTAMVALPYVDGAAVKVLRCAEADVATAGSWTVETAVPAAGEVTNSNPAALVTDGAKLWLFRVTPDAARDILYTDDAAAGAWSDEAPWKEGAAVTCDGVSARRISAGVGVVYLDTSVTPARVRYDRLLVLQAFATQNQGLVTGEPIDLGSDGPNDVEVVLAAGAAADIAGSVDFRIEHSPDNITWYPAGGATCEAGASLRDLLSIAGVGRWLRLSTTVTGDASDVGGSGV
jgi:hypothetical protein